MNVIEVVDVPEGVSEDEARALLNKPCEVNRYMLVQVLPLPGGAARAFYRLVSSAYDKKPGERNQMRTRGDGNEDAARDVVAANLGKSVREIVDLLKQAGIQRGKTWVSEARMSACRLKVQGA
jgi:hypothetical protein